MTRARIAVAGLLALSTVGTPLGPAAVAPASPLVPVAAGGVVAYVPHTWEARALPSRLTTVSGVQASAQLDGWAPGARAAGIEAYWVDATLVGLPSDYYRGIAGGPALDRLPIDGPCRAEERTVWTKREQAPASPLARAEYLATATGTCRSGEGWTRWGAFVAAPGFGATRSLGIPRSGLYFAFVSVREGPGADRRLNRLLTSVSFGGTPVREFLQAVGAPSNVV